jgi:hypothetical protein
LFVIRVGVGMVFVLPRDAGAEDQLLLEPGGGPLDAALVEQFEVDAAGFVPAEAVIEGVLQLIEGKVPGAARFGTIEERAMPSVTFEVLTHDVTPSRLNVTNRCSTTHRGGAIESWVNIGWGAAGA